MPEPVWALHGTLSNPLSIAFVSTHPPRQCGIATFTSDLADAIVNADSSVRTWWAALDEAASSHPYGSEVQWHIRQGDPASYRAAAEQINAAPVDIVSIQHEFGLYGLWGETFTDHLTPFLQALRKPVVTTLHTVLPQPSSSVRAAVQTIGAYSEAVVAMAEVACRILVQTYGVEERKVQVIPHGVPPIQPRGRSRTKEALGLEGRTVICTFGLVDPRKGLEYMIRAMTAVVARHPDALYVIVGRTHPELVRREGESYRERLTGLVATHGLTDHVMFVDEYLELEQVIKYLLASDVYVTPYLDPNQITSGTLAYALGAGKAIVSTRYLHAVESLAGGRGLLADFHSEHSLADAVLGILDNPALKRQLEHRAYAYGRLMAWPEVGQRTLELYRRVAATGAGVVPELARVPDRLAAGRSMARTSAAGVETSAGAALLTPKGRDVS